MLEKFKDVDAHAVLIETELTHVIGDANFLKESKEETYKMFMLFKMQADRLFDRARQGDFEKLILDFESDLSNLDDKISKTLNEQFKSVKSSLDKFKMLEKFKSIYKVLKDESADNFTEVLQD
jgi:valyl-tRNA synthetase